MDIQARCSIHDLQSLATFNTRSWMANFHALLLTNTGKTRAKNTGGLLYRSRSRRRHPSFAFCSCFCLRLCLCLQAPLSRRIIHSFTSLAIVQPVEATPVPARRQRSEDGNNESEGEPDLTSQKRNCSKVKMLGLLSLDNLV
jgi:hypothetical protein